MRGREVITTSAHLGGEEVCLAGLGNQHPEGFREPRGLSCRGARATTARLRLQAYKQGRPGARRRGLVPSAGVSQQLPTRVRMRSRGSASVTRRLGVRREDSAAEEAEEDLGGGWGGRTLQQRQGHLGAEEAARTAHGHCWRLLRPPPG